MVVILLSVLNLPQLNEIRNSIYRPSNSPSMFCLGKTNIEGRVCV